ncbi:uncharacterized protein BJ212DRAFT_1358731 [Suillus subaureus]|uniref:Uncharacterized protein n=1 Tax=Suillus subaureus TaxID=48587 RepID=A0A9P7E983_9AGAM|nr:uncharacterized protein BJ212DRAFT_1358731 [Suillus subaureus]KAG1814999.1 hypothetical protein BJ212DRAFT_1358731 [Suillus subaureus]
MPNWKIISPCETQYVHPMQMNVFRVMKTVVGMLYPSALEELSTIDDLGGYTAVLGYTFSQEPPDLSGLSLSFAASWMDSCIFVRFRDMQIQSHTHDVCAAVPSELTPVIMDIYDGTETENYFARRIWKQLQVERYHQRVSQQQVPGGTDTRLPPAFWKCSICGSDLIHCNSCQVASCESRDCRGSSEPPLARCITHPKEVLCLPCLEHQNSKRLEQCPVCNFWCCAKDKSLCTGRPVGIESHPVLWGHFNVTRLIAYFTHGRAHPHKPESCLECEIPGWRSCSNRPFCWSSRICPKCASSGVMCLCERVWACDLCAQWADVFIRCPRCDRPFCITCSYIDRCKECHRVSLCYDCAKEAPDADEVMPVEVASSCESCLEGVRRCRIYSWEWR